MESLHIAESLRDLEAAEWDALLGPDPASQARHPFVKHAFLNALIETGCASARTGWQPQFLILRRAGALAGAMPLFVKSHSYGEYVFDWAWADAYARHGVEYYPKLLCAVPFTPVSGPRLLGVDDAARRTLLDAALEMAQQVSSLHVLFPTQTDAALMQERGMMLRRTVQFHWENAGDADFEGFLGRMSHRRRKNIRQERRRVRDAGVTFRWLRAGEITQGHWEFFYRCYRTTYAAHGSRPYLNLPFFVQFGTRLAQHVVMVVAERAGAPVAASLLVRGGEALFGRYWGAVEHIPLLHFECCYYQAIEYAIAHGLRSFEGGAQGEHKLFRGLMPVETLSAHWLAHPAFARAVDDFLERERRGIARYVNELAEHSPYKAV
ncbi:MAG: GNAT family N-acetyltransferase [Betaproteobacteria bacterium]|nr:GNAT family N-acetyltransferase [Betaproteobacteria bacterium]